LLLLVFVLILVILCKFYSVDPTTVTVPLVYYRKLTIIAKILVGALILWAIAFPENTTSVLGQLKYHHSRWF
jgi:hypothetical protein